MFFGQGGVGGTLSRPVLPCPVLPRPVLPCPIHLYMSTYTSTHMYSVYILQSFRLLNGSDNEDGTVSDFKCDFKVYCRKELQERTWKVTQICEHSCSLADAKGRRSYNWQTRSKEEHEGNLTLALTPTLTFSLLLFLS
jgi:hypothetical protein